jgi:pimeloyl-ACP methyl ester carboxylesterase
MKPFSDTKRYYRRLSIALLAGLALSGCMTYNGTRRAHLERLSEYLPEPERPVIVIPGFGNSRLYDKESGQTVWGHTTNLVRTRYSDDLDLPVDADTLEFGLDNLLPDGGFAGARASFNIAFTLSSALQDYGRYLDGGDRPEAIAAVHTFAYDWRLSATTNARRLDELIDSIRAAHLPQAPRVDLVAHSAGGLVALAYLKLGVMEPDASPDQIDLASRLAASKVASVTLLGVPQLGTNEAVRALARGDRLLFRELSPAMMASFPSIPEMLPADGKIFIDEDGRPVDLDVWDVSTWEKLGFAIWSEDPSPAARAAFARSLERARRLQKLLVERPIPEGVRQIAIASDCVPTATRVLLRADRSLAFYPSELRAGEQGLGLRMFAPGDGSIEARSALGHSESTTHVFCAGHHAIVGDPSALRTMLRGLLQHDATARVAAPTMARMPSGPSMETPNTR